MFIFHYRVYVVVCYENCGVSLELVNTLYKLCCVALLFYFVNHDLVLLKRFADFHINHVSSLNLFSWPFLFYSSVCIHPIPFPLLSFSLFLINCLESVEVFRGKNNSTISCYVTFLFVVVFVVLFHHWFCNCNGVCCLLLLL